MSASNSRKDISKPRERRPSPGQQQPCSWKDRGSGVHLVDLLSAPAWPLPSLSPSSHPLLRPFPAEAVGHVTTHVYGLPLPPCRSRFCSGGGVGRAPTPSLAMRRGASITSCKRRCTSSLLLLFPFLLLIPCHAFLGSRPPVIYSFETQGLTAGGAGGNTPAEAPSSTIITSTSLWAAQPRHPSQQHPGGVLRGPDLREMNKNMNYWGKRRDFRRVMELLEQVEQAGLTPNIYTFNAVMNACVLCRCGEETTNRLWERMVSTWGLRPNAVTYNTLIKRFFGSKSAKTTARALMVLEEMEREAVAPDVMTFNELINVCVETGEMDKATGLIRDMESRGLRPDIMTYTTLIKGYGLKGNLTSAFDTLERMRAQNVPLTTYSCNVLADACIRCQQPAKALKLFRDFEASVQGGGLRMLDLRSYNIMIKAYREMDKLEGAWETLEELKVKGFVPDVVTYNTLVDACCKGQQPERAKALIHEMMQKGVQVDRQTLHPLLLEEVLTRSSNISQAMDLARGLLGEYGFMPDNATICTLMEAMVDLERPRDAVQIFIDSFLTTPTSPGHSSSPAPPSTTAYNTLIKAYREYVLATDPEDDMTPLPLAYYSATKPPTITTATTPHEILHAAIAIPSYMRSSHHHHHHHHHPSSPDSITFNILMDMAAELGDIDALNTVEAERTSFGLGLDHYLIHSQMKCYAVRGDLAGVTDVKERMDRLRVPPNERTFSVLVLSLLRCGEVAKAEILLRNALARSLYIHDSLFMAFLHHYAMQGQVDQVDATFRAFQDKGRKWNVSVWNSFIGALAIMGQVEKAENAFDEMVQAGVRPTSQTYYSLVKASCVAKDLDNAMSWLHTMRQRQMRPDVKAYNWVIHTALDVEDTHRLVQVMGDMEADGVVGNRVTARAKERIMRALASRIKNVGEGMLMRLGRTMSHGGGR